MNSFRAAKKANIHVQKVPRNKLDQLGDHHQGVAASVAAYDYLELEDLLNIPAKKNETPFFVLLDELEDPHNLGSIMPTADADWCTWDHHSEETLRATDANRCESFYRSD